MSILRGKNEKNYYNANDVLLMFCCKLYKFE